ncbi:MAG: Lrp/AsnC family transcriptional regulator [Candidatus Micrarchaeota archaeon]|nr:Lrp/AsnC family transcriptional regulator [Candidatus Micrarchaeota archaeon]
MPIKRGLCTIILMEDLSDAYDFHSEFNDRYSIATRKVLRILSENSRASVSEIAKYAQVSRRTAAEKIEQVKKAFGVKFTVELNEQALGMNSPHIIVVKFKQKPDYVHILRVLNSTSISQVAALTKGDYDMFVYANALSGSEYAHWYKSMQILFSRYGVSWLSSEVVHKQLGFFPLRNDLIDRLGIAQKYKDLLKILNEDSRASFQSISKSLGMHFNTVAYNFAKLLQIGYIKRFTITMQPSKELAFMSFFSRYSPVDGYEDASSRARKAFMSDDKDSLISRYILSAPLIGSYDFMTMGVFDSLKVAKKNDIDYHKYVLRNHGTKLESAYLDRVLQGRLPIRSLDTKRAYDTIKWTPSEVRQAPPIN